MQKITAAEVYDEIKKWSKNTLILSPDAIMAIATIVNLEQKERIRAFRSFQAFFCIECGSDDPSCQCWNDE